MSNTDEMVEKTEEQKAAEEAERDRRYALDRKRDQGLARMALLIQGIGQTTDAKEQSALAAMLHREYNRTYALAEQLGDASHYYNNNIRVFDGV